MRIAAAATAGGTASALGGGKFANGAVTAAFSRAFNDERAHTEAQRQAVREAKAGRFGEDTHIHGKMGPFAELKLRTGVLAIEASIDLGSINWDFTTGENFISQRLGIAVHMPSGSIGFGIDRVSTNGGMSFYQARYGSIGRYTISSGRPMWGVGGGLGFGGEFSVDLISPAGGK